MNDRSPWAAPRPQTAHSSNAWAAPINGAGYPQGFVDRLRDAEPDHPMLKKRTTAAPAPRPRATAKPRTTTRKHAPKRRKWGLLDIKGAKRRIKRKLSPKRYLKRKAKRILRKRILLVPAGTRYNAPKKRLDLGSLRGAKPGQHTKGCRAASMVGGRVDHRAIRTPGCPGCNALGPTKGGRR